MESSTQKIDFAALLAIAVFVGGIVVLILALAVVASVIWP